MCCWDDGDYFEPGEFDEKIEELIRNCRVLRETSSR